jgi:hypothetical protein
VPEASTNDINSANFAVRIRYSLVGCLFCDGNVPCKEKGASICKEARMQLHRVGNG